MKSEDDGDHSKKDQPDYETPGHVIDVPADIHEGGPCEKYTHERWHKAKRNWLQRALKPIGLYTMVLMFVAIGQWWITHRQLEEMRLAREALTVDQRAWIGPIEAIIPESDSEPYGVWISNSGRTPGLNVVTTMSQLFIPIDEKFVPRYNSPGGPYSSSVIQPGMRIRVNGLGTRKAFGANEERGILTGTHRMYLYGRIEYRDIFKRPRWTTFCLYMASNFKSFEACETYNDAE
jgi:hypothetical protein